MKVFCTDRRMLAAARLFFWMKANCPQDFLIDSELREKMLGCFSAYEIDRHLKYLKENFWVTTDKEGRHYLQGAAFYRLKFFLKNKKYLVAEISSFDLQTRENWRRKCCGTVALSVHRSASRSTKKKNRECLVASKKLGGKRNEEIPGFLPLSIAFFQNHVAVSKATASRIRKRAALGGFVESREQLLPFTRTASGAQRWAGSEEVRMSRAEFLAYRGDVAEVSGVSEANKLVWKNGLVLVQLPTLVRPLSCLQRKM